MSLALEPSGEQTSGLIWNRKQDKKGDEAKFLKKMEGNQYKWGWGSLQKGGS